MPTIEAPQQRIEDQETSRSLPVGAEFRDNGTSFRVWAPSSKRVEVVFHGDDERAVELTPEDGGYFSVLVPDGAGPGTRYKYRLDGGERYPDPVSRFQPDGPHGPSEIVDSRSFRWTDQEWPGLPLQGQIIYELHVGTFSPEGTYAGVEKKLQHLVDSGVTVIELMPVNTFPGKFGWGYDGVQLFAPYAPYGTPDDLRKLINAAHKIGLGVMLDVVYNHFGPDGNYMAPFSPSFFTKQHKTAWGDAINFDAEGSDGVREFFIANARYWVEEFHFDGLRLDAVQAIVDSSGREANARYPQNILTLIREAVKKAAGGRETIVVAENEREETLQLRSPDKGGFGLDAIWNDDFHHSVRVALTGHHPAYYVDHAGTAQELASAAKYGFLFQGQTRGFSRAPRGGTTRDLQPWQFINFIENHDQVANSRQSKRLRALTSPGRYRAACGLLLLGPGTPMLFQGQEFGATSPFPYFAHHKEDLAKLVQTGRNEALLEFVAAGAASKDDNHVFPDPSSSQTVERARLRWNEAAENEEIVAMFRDLMWLRRRDPVFAWCEALNVDAALLSETCFVVHYWAEAGERLLVVNMGGDLHRQFVAEPLIAPPEGQEWQLLWSSEDLKYGGSGTPQFEQEDGWYVSGESAAAFHPVPRTTPVRQASSLNGLIIEE